MGDEKLTRALGHAVELLAVVNNFDGDDAEQEKAHKRLHELEAEILATPAESIEGIRVKLEIWNRLVSDEASEPPMDEREGWVSLDHKFGVSALRDARRLSLKG